MKRARFVMLLILALLLIPASLYAGVPPGRDDTSDVFLVLDEVQLEAELDKAVEKADVKLYGGFELLTADEAASILNKLVLYQNGWLYYHPMLLQSLIAYDWIMNSEPKVEVPDAVVVTTKRDVIVKYNGPLSVQVGPLDYNITLQPIVAKDIMPRIEKTPLVWGVVGGFAGGVIITLLLSALL